MRDGKNRMVMLVLKKSLDYINKKVTHKFIGGVIRSNR